MLLFSLLLILNSHFRPQKEYWETIMEQFSYQKYYSLCRFNYVRLSFNYVFLSSNYYISSCLFDIQLCSTLSSNYCFFAPFLREVWKWCRRKFKMWAMPGGKGENYQRVLTLLNEAVDILRSPCTSRDHPQQLPAHRYVGSVQVPATFWKGRITTNGASFSVLQSGRICR